MLSITISGKGDRIRAEFERALHDLDETSEASVFVPGDGPAPNLEVRLVDDVDPDAEIDDPDAPLCTRAEERED